MTETRKLPRKTIIWITIIIIIGVGYFLLNMVAKQTQVENALANMNVPYEKLKVFTSSSIKHNETGIKGYQFTVRYINSQTKELCKGFVVALDNGEFVQDVICKKEELW